MFIRIYTYRKQKN